jgi:tight adherence protein C
MPFVIAAAVGVAILILAFVGTSVVADKAELRESLRRLEGYQIQGVRDQEMLAPLSERVFSPVVSGLTGLAHKYTPAGYVENLRRKLVLSGGKPGLDVDQLLVLKLLGVFSGIAWFLLFFFALGLSGFMGIIATLGLWAASFLAVDVVVNRAVAERKHAMAVQLPDILDLLVISVEAGLGFEQALDRTADAVPGALAEEFNRMLQEMRIGSSRSDSLRALDERTEVPELRSFILAMLQADTFGVSISRLLRAQATEMRIRRRLRAQEQAQKAPVIMLFPLVFCIFPSVFVIILGPALIQISNTLT